MKTSKKMGRNIENLVKGYTAIFASAASYVGVICLIQTFGKKSNIFLLNCMRFAIEAAFAVVIATTFCYSVKVAKKDIYKFVLSLSLNYAFIVAFYSSSYTLPGGNLDGLYGGLYILIATFFDVAKGTISKLSIATSSFAILGILLLTQPWHMELQPPKIILLPCEYLEGTNITFSDDRNITFASFNQTISFEMLHSPSKLALFLGYFYLLVASISNVVAGNIYRNILQDYSIYCLLFWSGFFQFSLSAIITISLKFYGVNNISLPKSGPCLWFILAFVLSACIAKGSTNIASKYMPVSKIALSTPVTTVILYIFQRTVLNAFHPGHANFLEIIGIVCIFLAALLSPLITILFEYNLIEYKKADDYESIED